MVFFCVVTLIMLIGSMSYEEEDTCHVRRRIHIIRIFFYVVTLIILIVFASSSSSSSSSSLSLSLSLSLYLSISLSLLSLSLSRSRPLAPSLSLPLSRPPSHSRTESQTLLPPTIPLTSYRPLYLSGFSVVFSLV
jgi:membrane-associated HD superfamily phosphohydrolase